MRIHDLELGFIQTPKLWFDVTGLTDNLEYYAILVHQKKHRTLPLNCQHTVLRHLETCRYFYKIDAQAKMLPSSLMLWLRMIDILEL